MAEINIPTGPVSRPPFGAIRHVRRELPSDATATALHQVLDGLELGAHDLRIVEWLARQTGPTVATVCSWILRARALTPDGMIAVPEPAELGLDWLDETGGDLLALVDGEITIYPRGVDEYGMDADEADEWAGQLASMAQALRQARPVPVDLADEQPAGGGA